MAASRVDRARQLVEHANEQIGSRRIRCTGCGETIGYYRPGRVERASPERPRVRIKCLRRGCRTETLIVLDEVES